MKNIFEYIPFLILQKIAQTLGFNRLTSASKFLAFILHDLLKIRREVVIKNLSIAFPELKQDKLNEISKKCYLHFSRFILEIMNIPKLNIDEIKNLVECDEHDLSEIRKEYQKGRGLVFLTAHLGNWELGAISIPVQMNLKIYPIIKPQRNPYVTNWLNKMRETHGNEVIPLGISIKKIYKVLTGGGLLGVVGDQRGPKEGQRVKLFGRDTAIFSGTAEIVAKTNTPLFCLFAVRVKDHYKAFVERIDVSDMQSGKEERINAINQRYAELLEKYVRLYPEQWFWMHNIWKY
ncbi:MAG: lysophospholipid acyltransferase family protein [Melioribacteraceae bacterium]|nr:lysophospholipid acyltransferase family protein [Melioribacteraceae bacterium]